MRTGVPCNENKFFSVGIGSQGVPSEPYSFWVCSECRSVDMRVEKKNKAFAYRVPIGDYNYLQ